MHRHAIKFLGRCECPCHHGADECWCGRRRFTPIAHNDAVRHLGACPAHLPGAETDCNVRTEVRWAQAFARVERSDTDRRIRRGQIRSSADVRRAAQLGIVGRPTQH